MVGDVGECGSQSPELEMGICGGGYKEDGGTTETAKGKGKISGAHSQIRNSVFGGEEDEK